MNSPLQPALQSVMLTLLRVFAFASALVALDDAGRCAEPGTHRRDGQKLVPSGWDAALAGDVVMERLLKVTGPNAKGAHDAEFECVGDRAFVVEHDNDVQPGHGAGHQEYCVLTVINLSKLEVERTIPLAKSGEAFENETLPVGACFVPRILKISETTLRCYFASEDGNKREAQTWFRDFNLETLSFEARIHKVRLKTRAGVFDMQPQFFHADAVLDGFARPAQKHGLYLFDSFKVFEGKRYVAINNFPGKQNALALVHPDYATFEIVGHYNEPQSAQLSESAVNRLPDGTWMAICRNDSGNYHFTTSPDGRVWSVGKEIDPVNRGLNSKPTFDQFGGVYYLGWQENTKIRGCGRSVFNIEVSRDGRNWERKYRFETPHSFQYPTLHEHQGNIWLSVSQSDHKGTTDRIMFGKLESVGDFESQAGKKRTPLPEQVEESAVMRVGVTLFNDRDYVALEVPEPVREKPFLRTSIERIEVEVVNGGVLYAMTPGARLKAACQEVALKEQGFAPVAVPEVQLFPGEINRVGLYRRDVKQGERFNFQKMVVLVMADGAVLKEVRQ